MEKRRREKIKERKASQMCFVESSMAHVAVRPVPSRRARDDAFSRPSPRCKSAAKNIKKGIHHQLVPPRLASGAQEVQDLSAAISVLFFRLAAIIKQKQLRPMMEVNTFISIKIPRPSRLPLGDCTELLPRERFCKDC